MKPHDYEGLNDFLCWHADHFTELLDLWRRRNLGKWTCYKLARSGAQKWFPLDEEEAAVMSDYVRTRFGEPKDPHEPRVVPMPVMVVG